MDDGHRIDRAALEELFANIRAKTSWPIDGDMLWGYFFADTDRDKLERCGRELEALGYRFVGVQKPEDDDDETLFLRVERIETHTVDTLEERNMELYALADRLGLQTYDGMDVNPVPLPN